MNTRRFALLFAVLSCLCAFVSLPAISQDEDEAEAEARKTAERFLLVLERNPRKGTALDKVVEFHIDHESLDELVTGLREKAEATEYEDAGRAWLVVGLVEASRGDAESAQVAFERAEELLPKSAVASFSLGQNLMTLNRWGDAAAALERAIQRKPAPTDLLDVFHTLGRVQQRLAPGDKVVDVWARLEKLVPNDPRVPELIAKTLLDDGHWEAALPRFESLAKATKDLYRRSEFELEVVDLRLKLGQFDKALTESDRLLGGLKPDHWLFRETRRRVEEAFLAKDDTAGLIKHYDERLTKQPDDFDAIVRLSRALTTQGRPKDARSRLEAGIKIAPMSVDLRLELIELLKSEQQFADAIAQYEQLDRIEPNHPDHVRDWGFLILKSGEAAMREDKTLEHAKRAAAIWRKLVEAKPKDAVVAAQVADLMASADKSLLDDAAELLRRAIELEPNALSHREQLGETLDSAGKKDESLAAWRSMAEEPRRSADNLAHLAEVLSRFGYRDESLTTVDAACELDRKSLELRFQQAELRRKWKQAESAMAALKEAAALADTPETFDRVVQLEVKVLSESELLSERIEELSTALGAGLPTPPKRPTAGLPERDLVPNKAETFGPDQRRGQETRAERAFDFTSPAAQHFRHAKYLEAADKLREATVAARKAVELAPKNGVFIQAAARMLTQDSQWLSAVELHERLMKLDRRFRIDSLRSIAELEQKLGRKEKALKAGRDLLAAAPGNPEVAEFVADVSLRFNQNTEALQILRRASRQNVADKRLALKLVDRLMEVGSGEGGVRSEGNKNARTSSSPLEEAREILWRVFEQTAKSDDRIEIVRKLAELSVFPGEFTKLTQRLERLRHEPKLARDATLALVQVHEQAGDTEQARRELERLLPQSPRDVELLKRMVSLSESTGDLDTAIVHQKRLAEVTRRRETDEHLILLLRRAGRDADADSVASRWLESERDPVKVLREIDRILTAVSSPANARSEKQPAQLALKLAQSWRDRDPQNWEFMLREALALAELQETEKAKLVRDEILKLEISDDVPSLLVPAKASSSPVVERIDRIRRRFAVRELPIADFGQARQIAIDGGLLYGTFWLDRQRPGQRTDRPEVPAVKNHAELRRAWDDVYWFSLRPPEARLLPACLALQDVAPDDSAAHWLALRALKFWRQENIAYFFDIIPMSAGEPLDNVTIDRLLASLRRLLKHSEVLEWESGFPLPELVARELRRAGREDDLTRLIAEVEETNTSLNGLGWLIQYAARRSDADEVARLLRKYVALAESSPALAIPSDDRRYANPGFVAWWVQNVMMRPVKAEGQAASAQASKERALKILDDVWDPLAQMKVPSGSNMIVRELIHLLSPRQASSSAPSLGQPALTPSQFQSIAASGQGWLVWQNTTNCVPRTVEFPAITKAAEFSALRVLMQVHAIAAESKWSSELREHMQSKGAKAEPLSREKYLALLSVASLLVWEGKNDEALPVMREVFDLAIHLPSLQFDIAGFHQRYGSQEVALDLLDRIETKDGQQLKEIEQRAVLLAGKLHRTDRVQLAAERLFGMKLEPAEEQQLAATLSGLGLHEHAEAIRQRLPQRAGNNLTVLQQAMQERIEAKKLDEACQIAEQIVRRTSPANTLIGSVQQSTFGGGQQARVITQTSQARTKALALLGQQGRLGPLIEQAEQQFDRSPQSLKLFGQLVELYSAAGTPEKQTGLLVRLADSDSPDPQFRLTLARALVSAGKAPLAVPHFLFAIEKLPNATAQVLFEAEAILSELGHVDELAAIVLKSKLAVNDQQRVELFSRIVQRLEGPPIRAKLIIDLFAKALREAPDFRPMLAARLLSVSESVWQQEEMWPIARDLVVPSADRTNAGAWYGVDVTRLSSGQQIDSLTKRTVELAAQLKKLDEFAANVELGIKTHPDWYLGGNIVFGFIRLRQKHPDVAKDHFNVLFERRPIPENVAIGRKEPENLASTYPMLSCLIGAELARAGELEAAVRYYEKSGADDTVLEHCRWFGKEPAMQQLAVRIVNRMLAGLDNPERLSQQAGSPLFVEAAKITAEINQPYVAARLAQAMITRWQLPGANNSDGGTWLEQLDLRFANSLAAIEPAMLPEIVTQSASRVDLLPHVTGDSLANLRLDSPFVPLLKEAAKDKGLWSKWRMGTLARPSDDTPNNAGTGKSAHPPNLSLAILLSLSELFAPETNPERTALTQLAAVAKSFLKTKPSRTAPSGFHPQLGLWLVARECLVRDEHKKLGEDLAELATESASLHFDPRFQWAILRERGELALKAGDKELASRLWTRLAVDVLRPRSAEETVPMLLGKDFVWSANWPSTRLHRARELCRLTLNAEMPDLSLAIFRDTINWPKTAPFQPKFASDESSPNDPPRYRGTAAIDEKFMADPSLAKDILATWDMLEQEWRAKGVAADAIFATLLECVLPTDRPDEVFVFAVQEFVVRTLSSERSDERPDVGVRSTARPQSLALRLVELAVAEKRSEALTQRLVERDKTATNPLALRLMHLLLARLTNDDRRLDAELTKLAQHDWSQPTLQNSRIATQIVSLLTPLTERREQIAKLFEQWVAPVSKAFPRDEHPLGDLRRWLAKQQLDQQQTEKAKETISSHLRHMDQVWSATGAMDGQHLRRLELLTIATDYASVGLTREAIDLLAQVADARWPDRYPDENPGAVLAILEAKLKSRPAQERYELWRVWSLPNDGVKSMRMLTGGIRSGQRNGAKGMETEDKSVILKSSAFLLVEAAREADRLAELDAFVEDQMKQRPSDRIHVLLALIHLANKSPSSAEPLVRQQITLWESQSGKNNSATRTRTWDDWLLSVTCSRHESLRELADQLAKRAEMGARETRDEELLRLIKP